MADTIGLHEELADMLKSVERIEDRLAFVTDPVELADGLCALFEVANRVDALKGRIGLAAENNGLFRVTNQRTVGQYVAARTGLRATDVNRPVKRADWAREFPVFDAAFGIELADAHIDHLKSKLDLDDDYRAVLKNTDHQEALVNAAATCSFRDFVTACEYWKQRTDVEGKEPKDQLDNARLTIRTGRGGRAVISGECDAVSRLELETAIENEADKLRKADKAAGVERSAGQRRMAALLALVKRGAARPDGTLAGPLGHIVMSQNVLEWALGQLAGTDEPTDHVPVDPFDIDGRCELIDGTPIHPFLACAALRLAGPGAVVAKSTLRRYVLDADSRILDVSVNARSFPDWE